MQNEKQKKDAKTTRLLKLDAKFEVARTLLAIFIAMILVIVIVAFVSDDPLYAIQTLLFGPFTSLIRFSNVIELMIPLTFTGLAVTVIFKADRFNLASEGAFYMGAAVTAMIAIFSPYNMLITMLLILIALIVVGTVIGSIPAILNKKFYANELVTSLMLNYIIAFLVRYLLNNVMRDTTKTAIQSLPIRGDLRLTKFIPGTRIHTGLFAMIAIVFITWVVLYKTKWGYALRATGANEKFARYSGINVSKVVILTQIIGITLAAIGGGVEMLGMHSSFKWTDTPGYGFDGVLISILANGNPALVPLAAFFLAFVRVGSEVLNRTSDIPAEIVSVVQATIILLIAARAFLAKYKHKMIVKETGIEEAGE